jgi:uncharacterized protein HemX
MVLVLALALGAGQALAQNVEQQENRRILREQQRQMEDLSLRRELDARERERAIERRAERDALELRLDRSTPLIEQPRLRR